MPGITGHAQVNDVMYKLSDGQLWFMLPSVGRWESLGTPAKAKKVPSHGLPSQIQKKDIREALRILSQHNPKTCDSSSCKPCGGPSPQDLWPIHYLGPFSREPMWLWTGQWALDAWPNRVIGVTVLAVALWLPIKLRHSVVGVFNRRADSRFVAILRRWHTQISQRFKPSAGPAS